MAKSYVLLDLVSINVTTKKTNNDTIVFCDSITVEKREDQSFESIDDWSNIIIGNSKYNVDGKQTVNVSTIDTNSGAVTLEENIGLWSVILFKTITDKDGAYTKLNDVISGSSGVGGSGTGETGVEEVYFDNNITEYAKNTDLVNDFLKDVLGNTFNGCIFIDNSNCGIFLNISALMFNEQANLEKISLTNTIVYIGETSSIAGVFSNCNNLVNANIPEYLGCYNIIETKQDGTTSTKNNTTRTVPGYYFHNCKLLESIIIPDGITQIGFSSFYGCDSVKTINIPSSVLTVYSNSLLTVNREETRYINVNGDVDDKTDITFFSKSVGYNKPSNNNTPYCQNTVIISINNRGIVNLYGSISLNDTSFITNVKNDSKIYIDCEKINGVSIGNTTNSSTKFYYGGFIGTTFETIYIGPTVENICDFAFYNVTDTNLIIDNNHILNKDYTDNTETDSLESNKYQDGTYLIKTPFAKSKFNNIDILNCETIGKYALHSLNSNNLTFYKEGYTTKLKDDLEITNNILLTTLSDYVFYNSSFGEITIPSSVNSISNTSFLQTKGSLILNCNISGYTTTVNQNEYKHTGILVNSEFSKITFDYVGSIPANVLYENKYINSIELGDNISQIYAKAFYLCTNLSNTLTIPSELSDISTDAFIGCIFSKFEVSESPTPTKYQTDDSGMYLLTDNKTSIVLFANKHTGIQIVDNTFNINIDGVTGIGNYAFSYAFSDYVNSNVYAVTISKNIKRFGGNVFYNCHKLTRITFYPSNIAKFEDTSTSPNDIEVNDVSLTGVSIYGSFSDLPLLKEVYIGYATGILLSDNIPNDDEKRNNFLYNTIRNSYTNNESDISKITIYVYEDLVETYEGSDWGLANYKIAGISKDVPPPPPVPPVENDDKYDADIDDPEGDEWPGDGGNGDITTEEDYIPPVSDDNTDTDAGDDGWIEQTTNNVFKVPIKQLGMPAINVYGCRLDLLNPTYHDTVPTNTVLIDNFGNINLSALDYLKFNKVSNENKYGSDTDELFKIYLGDAGNNFLVIFTVTGIDNFDATTKLFTSTIEYPPNRESNWLKTEIVRIVETDHQNTGIEPQNTEVERLYYVVLLCTCLKLQVKDNYNCRTAIVSVNYGSQMLDSNINAEGQIITKIKILQHKTELRLSNNTREINITDLPVLFCQQTEHTEFTGNFFIGFPKNFWSTGKTINNDGTSSNKNKLREYINDYFRILYDKEKIKVVGQKTKIGELDYTYIFDVADDKYANIKETGSTTSALKKFSLCTDEELKGVHEEYYYVNFKIENLKTSLAGGNWNISIYNIGEPAEMLDIQVIENQTDIPSIALYPTYATITGCSWDGKDFSQHEIRTNGVCSDIRGNNYVAAECQLPVSITNMPIGKNSTYIFPNIETTDICIDSSAVFTCEDNNMVMSADEITNNFNYALTINIKNNTSGVSSFNMPISSKTLKKQSLSVIKYKKTELNINPSIYNYDANSNTTVNACLTNKPEKITIERIGDKEESDILSNTGAFLYKINTGLSVIADTYTNYLTRTDNTISYMPIITNDDSTALDTIINASWVSIENNLCIDLFNDRFIIYDEYYNILAPIYPYYNELKYTIIDSGTLLINKYIDSENVYISEDSKTTYYINNNSLATGQTYYCTATNDILIQVDDTIDVAIEGYDKHVKSKRYIGQAYKVITTIGESPNIGVVKEVNNGINSVKYTEDCYGEHSYNGFSKATDVVTLIPICAGLEISNPPDVCTYIGDSKLQTYAADYKSHGKIIKVIDVVTVTYSGTKTDLYYEYNDKYYNLDGTEIVIKPTSFNIKSCAYFIYLNHNNMNDDGTFTIPNRGDRGYVVGIYDEKPSNPYVIEESGKITETKFYRIYNIDVDNAVGEYTNVNDVINKKGIYKDFNIPEPTIKYTNVPYETESYNIADMHVNTYDIACNNNVYRQIFVNFLYDVNDNNTITKIYADNSNGLILQTRMLNSKPNINPTFNTGITLFGLNIASSADNIGFTPSTISPQFQVKQ